MIIADHLANNGVEYGYEQPLTIGGVTKARFTIEDMESGSTFYREHSVNAACAQLPSPMGRKAAWYRSHGILPREEGGGENGALVITRDE
ncbi:MAG: hypothetical protein IPJ21_20250 [Sterolibacteriaceae bacterium]|nr:hypothetical protein [Sterolibacteriaceae bacterium]